MGDRSLKSRESDDVSSINSQEIEICSASGVNFENSLPVGTRETNFLKAKKFLQSVSSMFQLNTSHQKIIFQNSQYKS